MKLTKDDVVKIVQLISLSRQEQQTRMEKQRVRDKEANTPEGIPAPYLPSHYKEDLADPSLHKINTFLKTLSEEEKRKFAGVMYAGREITEGERKEMDTFEYYAKDSYTGALAEKKLCLHDYLIDGLVYYYELVGGN